MAPRMIIEGQIKRKIGLATERFLSFGLQNEAILVF